MQLFSVSWGLVGSLATLAALAAACAAAGLAWRIAPRLLVALATGWFAGTWLSCLEISLVSRYAIAACCCLGFFALLGGSIIGRALYVVGGFALGWGLFVQAGLLPFWPAAGIVASLALLGAWYPHAWIVFPGVVGLTWVAGLPLAIGFGVAVLCTALGFLASRGLIPLLSRRRRSRPDRFLSQAVACAVFAVTLLEQMAGSRLL